MTDTAAQIQAIADQAGVDTTSVRWLADYIARETPPEHAEELLADPNWIQACAHDWLRMTNKLNGKAQRHRDEAAREVLAHI